MKQNFIVSLDNDEVGRKATKELMSELNEINSLQGVKFRFYDINISQKTYKDENEALRANKEDFRHIIELAIDQVQNIEKEIMETERNKLKRESSVYCLPDFINNITKSKTAEFFSTGFSSLDSILDGGYIQDYT